MINFTEAQEEAGRLTKVTGRDVEVSSMNCGCDYSKNCGTSAGEGLYYQLVYASCGHVVPDGDDLECAANGCAALEQLSAGQSDVFPVKHPPLISLTEAASEREAA